VVWLSKKRNTSACDVPNCKVETMRKFWATREAQWRTKGMKWPSWRKSRTRHPCASATRSTRLTRRSGKRWSRRCPTRTSWSTTSSRGMHALVWTSWTLTTKSIRRTFHCRTKKRSKRCCSTYRKRITIWDRNSKKWYFSRSTLKGKFTSWRKT